MGISVSLLWEATGDKWHMFFIGHRPIVIVGKHERKLKTVTELLA